MYKYTSYIHVFVFEAQFDLGGLNAVHSQWLVHFFKGLEIRDSPDSRHEKKWIQKTWNTCREPNHFNAHGNPK